MKTLHYNIEIRDKDGKFYRDSKDNRIIKYFFFEDNTQDENLIALICEHTYDNYRAICKEGSEINIEVSYHDSISNSYPILYSFYGAENKFVKH